MPGTRYRRGELYAADMAHYARVLSEQNTNNYMLLYYGEGLKMSEIGERLGIDKSTVSRTIKRGEYRLRRCLRYGAKRFLEEDKPVDNGKGPIVQ